MSTDWKDTSYDLIIIIIDRCTKMVHSKLAQMINVPRLAKVFIDLVVQHHGPPDSIVSD